MTTPYRVEEGNILDSNNRRVLPLRTAADLERPELQVIARLLNDAYRKGIHDHTTQAHTASRPSV